MADSGDDTSVADSGDDSSVADSGDDTGSAARTRLDQAASTRASRHYWDTTADAYQADHGSFLGTARFVWGPEGLDEAEAGLLGPTAGLRVLELGCGAASCARWLRGQGAEAVGLDLAAGQLRHARQIDAELGSAVPVVQADAVALPFADGVFDLVCSAYGAVPFVADLAQLFAEVGRVLRPGGRWVWSQTHPIRWSLPDDPGPAGLTVTMSYWDTRAYVEFDAAGTPTYVEHHRTLGELVRLLRDTGFVLDDLVEPPWPDGHDGVWGGWSALRGRLVPGTAIFCTHRR
ncbi:MAG: class I SAM-dependent methyltransferase [Actinomycetota bacterium]|nr:MAG: class I SAM-dependent methyltransferase [Actinomycetota bacterium]